MPVSSKRRKNARPETSAPAEPLWRRVRVRRIWLIRAAIFLLLTTLYQYAVRRTVGITGDEPHYVMTVASLIYDGDFDESNNFPAGVGYVPGYPHALTPQVHMPDGRVLPEHGLGFPLLLFPPARLFGIENLKYFVMAVMGIAALILCKGAERVLKHPWLATIAGSVLILLPVWQIFGARLYPEVTAGTLALGAFLLVTTAEPGPWSALGAGVVIGYFPLLYLRFSSFAVFLFAIALLNPGFRRSAGFLFWFVLTLIAGAALMYSVYGTEWHFAAPASTLLTFAGSWERFWRLWFDRGHGVASANPVLLLLFWAAPALCWRAVRDAQLRPIAVLSLMLFAYSYEFALTPTSSGESPPGRFLCAIAPAALLVICYWIAPAGRVLRARAAAALAIAGVSAAIFFAGVFEQTPAWLALAWYQDQFPVGWPLPSFTAKSHAHVGQSAPLGLLLLTLLAMTTSAAALVHFVKTRRPTTLQSTTG